MLKVTAVGVEARAPPLRPPIGAVVHKVRQQRAFECNDWVTCAGHGGEVELWGFLWTLLLFTVFLS